MFFDIRCTVCKEDVSQEKLPIHSYWQIFKWGRTTHAVCNICKEKTHEEWIKNGWELVTDSE